MFANWIACLPTALCLLLGAGLVLVEVLLPGFGLPGISGIVLIAAGFGLTWMHHGVLSAIAVMLVLIAVLVMLISWMLRSMSGKRGQIFLSDKDDLRTKEDMQVLVGKQGFATSVLRPAGIGDFDGVRLNVVTEGGFIERDMPIEIVSVDGARIVVRKRSQAS